MKFSAIVNRINKEFQRLQTNPIENVIAVPDPKNIFQIHFCIYGLRDCPFEGGYYHGILSLSHEYPMKPPSIKVMTPNGRFEPAKNICTSFTNYHPETWQIMWNIEKMLIAMVSFLNDKESSTGVIQTSDSEKRQLARQSLYWNLKFNNNFIKFFSSFAKQLKIPLEYFSDPSKVKELEGFTEQHDQVSEVKPLVKLQKAAFILSSLFLIISAYVYLKIS